jgi:hypothetical protein
MGCCGDKKKSVSRPAPGARVVYSGTAPVDVRGAATGRIYRFSIPGQALYVDSRDAPSLVKMPFLKQA